MFESVSFNILGYGADRIEHCHPRSVPPPLSQGACGAVSPQIPRGWVLLWQATISEGGMYSRPLHKHPRLGLRHYRPAAAGKHIWEKKASLHCSRWSRGHHTGASCLPKYPCTHLLLVHIFLTCMQLSKKFCFLALFLLFSVLTMPFAFFRITVLLYRNFCWARL